MDDPSDRSCIACGAQAGSARRFRGTEYLTRTCPGCGLGSIANPPRGDQLTVLYSTGFYAPGPARRAGWVEFGHDFNNAVRMRQLRGLPIGRLLDMGSGRGRFLGAAKAVGWAVVGIELDQAWLELLAGDSASRSSSGDAVSPSVGGTFDAITMWHVLEHLPDPRAALDRAAALLRPGGTLIVSVPNNDSLQARLGGMPGCTWTSPGTSTTSPQVRFLVWSARRPRGHPERALLPRDGGPRGPPDHPEPARR